MASNLMTFFKVSFERIVTASLPSRYRGYRPGQGKAVKRRIAALESLDNFSENKQAILALFTENGSMTHSGTNAQNLLGRISSGSYSLDPYDTRRFQEALQLVGDHPESQRDLEQLAKAIKKEGFKILIFPYKCLHHRNPNEYNAGRQLKGYYLHDDEVLHDDKAICLESREARDLAGSFIHEMTHFSLHHRFGDKHTRPYAKGDKEEEGRLEESIEKDKNGPVCSEPRTNAERAYSHVMKIVIGSSSFWSFSTATNVHKEIIPYFKQASFLYGKETMTHVLPNLNQYCQVRDL